MKKKEREKKKVYTENKIQAQSFFNSNVVMR
jgi:hypothetical protein